MSQLALAIDIGGTRARTALIDAAGHILERSAISTQPEQGMDIGLQRICQAAAEIMGARPPELIKGIGVAAPGLVDPWRGIAFSPVNLAGWENVPLKDIFEQAFGRPARAGNDANLAALGEQRYGAGSGSRNMIYLTISTGIGGGIISEGRILLGEHGFAGEVGHCAIDLDGPLCNCGNRGCLEAMASGTALARDARAAIEAGLPSSLLTLANGDLNAVDAVMIGLAAEQGDSLARHLIDQAGIFIGTGIVNLMRLFDCDLFVLGGGVSNLGERLFSAIRRTAYERAFPAQREDLRIVPARLGDDAGLLGAAALVFDDR